MSTELNCLMNLQVNDDKVILDKTVADQVSTWKSSRGLTDESVKGHSCSGNTCSYTQIGDAYICEKTGRVHGNIYFHFPLTMYTQIICTVLIYLVFTVFSL
jgi:hypothetical protein